MRPEFKNMVPVIPAFIFAFVLFFSFYSCKKSVVPGQIYGTYIGTSTNTGLVNNMVADTFIISAGSGGGNNISILEKDYNVTLSGTVSGDDDTVYIPAQVVNYAGKSVTFVGTTGSVSTPYITLSILETINASTAGTLVFEGTD